MGVHGASAGIKTDKHDGLLCWGEIIIVNESDVEKKVMDSFPENRIEELLHIPVSCT